MRLAVGLLLLSGLVWAQTPVIGPLPTVVAKFDATGQSSNINGTLYAVPANAGGMYRVSCYTVITQAATTSSTLAQCGINWTDVDTNSGGSGGSLTTAGLTSNIVGYSSGSGNLGQATGEFIVNAKAGTNILYFTLNYASSGTTAMQYAVHIKLEYLGQ